MICLNCRWMREQYSKSEDRDELRIAPPAQWERPSYDKDCYFCMTNMNGLSTRSKHKVKYANIASMTGLGWSPLLCRKVEVPSGSNSEGLSGEATKSVNVTDDNHGDDNVGRDEIRGVDNEDDEMDDTWNHVTDAISDDGDARDQDDEEYIPAGIRDLTPKLFD
ncbi:hypothetical protein QAD02_007191 [Eretmocerus hayati]|uniref:Uncharacterized protein n=1 Tax=Eretmocerus hayati TaxID=131215 RepID=A0ACC2N2X8_9HYME|nr:hypothetical protein QAD02_007191 [Eretmocerus hayati]